MTTAPVYIVLNIESNTRNCMYMVVVVEQLIHNYGHMVQCGYVYIYTACLFLVHARFYMCCVLLLGCGCVIICIVRHKVEFLYFWWLNIRFCTMPW